MAVGFKTGGRSAGTPNKITSEIKDALSQFLQKEIDSIPEYFNEIEPKEKLEIMAKLLPYILPKQQAFSLPEESRKFVVAPKIILTKKNDNQSLEDNN